MQTWRQGIASSYLTVSVIIVYRFNSCDLWIILYSPVSHHFTPPALATTFPFPTAAKKENRNHTLFDTENGVAGTETVF